MDVDILKTIIHAFKNDCQVYFTCTKCGAQAHRRVCNIKRTQYAALCTKCLYEQTCMDRWGVPNAAQTNHAKESYKNTCLEKWGYESATQSPLVKQKIAATNKEKYGETVAAKSKIVRDTISNTWKQKSVEDIEACVRKRELTCLQHFGVKNPMQSEIIQQKQQMTCIQKFGVPFSSQSSIHKESVRDTWNSKTKEERDVINEKTIHTNVKRLGVSYPAQSPVVLYKMKQTCLERHGVENVFQDTAKVKQSYIDKWGVENPSQVPEIKEKKKQTSMKHWGADHPWKSDIVRAKIRQTMLKKFGAEYPMQSEIFRKTILEKAKQTNLSKYGKPYIGQVTSVRMQIKQTWQEKSPDDMRGIRVKSAKNYIYDNQSFDSSWELAVWIWAHDMGKCIKREPRGLKYVYENELHTYFPDFDIDGQLVEVKGDHFFDKKGNMICPFNKFLNTLYETKHQCGLKNGVQFWSQKDIEPILLYIEDAYGKHYLGQFKQSRS